MSGAAEERSAAAPKQQSPLMWLILALVIESPSHGYEIGKRYQATFGWFMHVNVSSVYSALERLWQLGMVEEVELEESDDEQDGARRKLRPARRSFRATPLGEQSYRRWVAEQMRSDGEQIELLSRIIAASVLGVDGMVDVVGRYRQECLEALRRLPAREGGLLALRGMDVRELADWLVVDQCRRELQSRIDWAADALAALRTASGEGEAR